MSRNIGGANLNAVKAKVVNIVQFVEAQFVSGTERFSTASQNISWGGHTWNRAGDLLSISEVPERIELSARGITISLSGVPSDLISLALDENYQNRTLKYHIGFLNDSGSLVQTPVTAGVFLMDQMNIQETGESSTISLHCEHRLVILQRANPARLTDEDQRIYFPTDEGLEFVTSIQKPDRSFGGSTSGGGAPGGGERTFPIA